MDRGFCFPLKRTQVKKNGTSETSAHQKVKGCLVSQLANLIDLDQFTPKK